jgi:hypothetical protein
MFRPWLPLRSNFTGIAWPALTRLKTPPLSTGWKNPWKPYEFATSDVQVVPSLVLPAASVPRTQTPYVSAVTGALNVAVTFSVAESNELSAAAIAVHEPAPTLYSAPRP